MRSNLKGMCCAGMLLFIILPALTIGFITDGIKGLHEAEKYKKPVQMTYEQFLHARPKAGWYRLTGCYLDLFGTAYEESALLHEKELSTVTEVCVPVHSLENIDEKSIHLVMITQDDKITHIQDVANRSADESRSEESRKAAKQEMDQWKVQDMVKLVAPKEIEGMVQTREDLTSSQTEEIDLLKDNLTPDYLIFEAGTRPSAPGARGSIGFGIFLLIAQALFWTWVVRSARQQPASDTMQSGLEYDIAVPPARSYPDDRR
ncbi:MAG TPA: hypothetical protein VFA07_04930 [Chthonomonadaceae bacterium]|nr:hypothetical protein [Chthonomonadaceae bacterium]